MRQASSLVTLLMGAYHVTFKNAHTSIIGLSCFATSATLKWSDNRLLHIFSVIGLSMVSSCMWQRLEQQHAHTQNLESAKTQLACGLLLQCCALFISCKQKFFPTERNNTQPFGNKLQYTINIIKENFHLIFPGYADFRPGFYLMLVSSLVLLRDKEFTSFFSISAMAITFACTRDIGLCLSTLILKLPTLYARLQNADLNTQLSNTNLFFANLFFEGAVAAKAVSESVQKYRRITNHR